MPRAPRAPAHTAPGPSARARPASPTPSQLADRCFGAAHRCAAARTRSTRVRPVQLGRRGRRSGPPAGSHAVRFSASRISSAWVTIVAPLRISRLVPWLILLKIAPARRTRRAPAPRDRARADRKSAEILFTPRATLAVGGSHWTSNKCSLTDELRRSGVRVTVLCPSPTDTKFHQRARMNRPSLACCQMMDAAT
jgi:hypothetical protein